MFNSKHEMSVSSVKPEMEAAYFHVEPNYQKASAILDVLSQRKFSYQIHQVGGRLLRLPGTREDHGLEGVLLGAGRKASSQA